MPLKKFVVTVCGYNVPYRRGSLNLIAIDESLLQQGKGQFPDFFGEQDAYSAICFIIYM